MSTPLLVREISTYTCYIFGGARVTAYLGRRIALVVDHEGTEGLRDLLAAHPAAVASMVSALERLLGAFDDACGRVPPLTHELEGRSVCEVGFLHGAAGLAHHGRAGFAIGPAFLEQSVRAHATGAPFLSHVFGYEACRNYIFPEQFTRCFDYRLVHEGPDCWGWVNQGFVNVLGCLLLCDAAGGAAPTGYGDPLTPSALVGVLFDYHGHTASIFLSDMESALQAYIDSALPWGDVFHRERLPWATHTSLDNVYSGLLVRCWRAHGRGRFLRRWHTGAMPLLLAQRAPKNKADWESAAENFFLAASYAAGENLAPLFAGHLRWPLREGVADAAADAVVAAAAADDIAVISPLYIKLADTALFAWLRATPHALIDARLALASFPTTGRGVTTLAPLESGELILRVPASVMLTPDAARAALAPLGPTPPLLLEDDALAVASLIFLEAGRVRTGQPGTWAAYVRSLPRASELLGVACAGDWRACELDLLRDVECRRALCERGAEVAAGLSALRALVDSSAAAGDAAAADVRAALACVLSTPSVWTWAVACVASRAFLDGLAMEPDFILPGTQDLLPLALVPGGDLFNHDSSGGSGITDEAEADGDDADVAFASAVAHATLHDVLEARWVRGAVGAIDGMYELRTRREYGAGEQLLISYGDRSSRDLLENFGWVPFHGGNAAEGISLDAGALGIAACSARGTMEKDRAALMPCAALAEKLDDDEEDAVEGAVLPPALPASALGFSASELATCLPPSDPPLRALRKALVEAACGMDPTDGALELELCGPPLNKEEGAPVAPPSGAASAPPPASPPASAAAAASKGWDFGGPPLDTLRILRALCVGSGKVDGCIAKLQGMQQPPGAGSGGGVTGGHYRLHHPALHSPEVLESPLSRRNEIVINCVLVALATSEMLAAYAPTPPPPPSATESGSGGGKGAASPIAPPPTSWACNLGADGVPSLPLVAASALRMVVLPLLAAPAAVGAGEEEVERGAGASSASKPLTVSSAAAAAAAAAEEVHDERMRERETALTRAAHGAARGAGVVASALAAVLAMEESLALHGDSVMDKSLLIEGGGASSTPSPPWEMGSRGDAHLAASAGGVGALARPLPVRVELARAYRSSRARVLLVHVQHACRMLQLASGTKPSSLITPAALASSPQALSLEPLPTLALEVLAPWAALIVSGAKAVETRAYPLPACALSRRVAILSSPEDGGFASHGLSSGSFVGSVIFSSCRVYGSREEWASDTHAHCVSPDAPAHAFGWDDRMPRYAWHIEPYSFRPPPLYGSPSRVALSEGDRIVRSLFHMPHAVAAAVAGVTVGAGVMTAAAGQLDAVVTSAEPDARPQFTASLASFISDAHGAACRIRVGVSATMQGCRASMEDVHSYEPIFAEGGGVPPTPLCYAVSVFDGHGGRQTADWAATHLVRAVTSASTWQNGAISMDDISAVKASLHAGFAQCDAELYTQGRDVHAGSGSTALVALLSPHLLYVANCGDCRAILLTNGGEIHPLSTDHRPDSFDERNRLRALAGAGIVRGGGYYNGLAVSRGLGDFRVKIDASVAQSSSVPSPLLPLERLTLTHDPDVRVHVRQAEDRILVLACDGVWDVFTNEDVRAHLKPLWEAGGEGGEDAVKALTSSLLVACLERGANDNLTLLVLVLE